MRRRKLDLTDSSDENSRPGRPNHRQRPAESSFGLVGTDVLLRFDNPEQRRAVVGPCADGIRVATRRNDEPGSNAQRSDE